MRLTWAPMVVVAGSLLLSAAGAASAHDRDGDWNNRYVDSYRVSPADWRSRDSRNSRYDRDDRNYRYDRAYRSDRDDGRARAREERNERAWQDRRRREEQRDRRGRDYDRRDRGQNYGRYRDRG